VAYWIEECVEEDIYYGSEARIKELCSQEGNNYCEYGLDIAIHRLY